MSIFRDEKNNKLSFTRVTSFILVLTYVISELYLLITEHKIVDIPGQLAALIAVLYGSNRLANNFIKKGGENETKN